MFTLRCADVFSFEACLCFIICSSYVVVERYPFFPHTSGGKQFEKILQNFFGSRWAKICLEGHLNERYGEINMGTIDMTPYIYLRDFQT
jgi:hypothetical protein